MNISNRPLFTSILINLLLFILLFIFCTPVYHSFDDIYVMYLLSGATSGEPSNLLHYDFIIHPFIGGILAFLFRILPTINWFSVLLYVFLFLAWVQIAYLIFKNTNNFISVITYLSVFLLFAVPVLLQPTFTDTSYLLSIAACTTILLQIHSKVNYKSYIIPGVLLTLAALLRIHATIPILALGMIAFLFIKNKKLFLAFYFVLFLSILLLNYLHSQYYIRKIPRWQKEEKYRSIVLSFDNHNKKIRKAELDSTIFLKVEWLQNGLLLDKNFIDTSSVHEIVKHKSGMRIYPEYKEEIKWFFINNKVYLLFYFSNLFMFILTRNKTNKNNHLFITLYQILTIISLHTFLMLFMKTPSTLLQATTLFTSLTLLYLLLDSGLYSLKVLVSGTALLFIAIAIVRIIKLNESNKKGRELFIEARHEVNMNKDKLYIAPYYSFPYKDIGVFDAPARYSIENVVTKNDYLNNTELNYYSKYDIRSARDLFFNNKVRFLGNTTSLIQEYLKFQNINGEFLPAPEKYSVLEAKIFIPIQ